MNDGRTADLITLERSDYQDSSKDDSQSDLSGSGMQNTENQNTKIKTQKVRIQKTQIQKTRIRKIRARKTGIQKIPCRMAIRQENRIKGKPFKGHFDCCGNHHSASCSRYLVLLKRDRRKTEEGNT